MVDFPPSVEPINFAANIAFTMMLDRQPEYTVRRPEASPIEAHKMERNNRMTAWLSEALTEASEEGITPSRGAVAVFDDLLRLLPDHLPAVEPYISGFGSVCLDWDWDSKCQLSLFLQDNDTLGYNAYFAGESKSAYTHFAGTELPVEVRGIIKEWSERASA